MPIPSPPSDIYEAVVACQAEGTPAAVAIIVAASGSTPQKTGAKMLVKADGSTVGTVGGGAVEAQVIQTALKVMHSGTPRLLDLELTEAAGYLCGGHLRDLSGTRGVAAASDYCGGRARGPGLSGPGSFCGLSGDADR